MSLPQITSPGNDNRTFGVFVAAAPLLSAFFSSVAKSATCDGRGGVRRVLGGSSQLVSGQ